MDSRDAALIDLGVALLYVGYRFAPVAPATRLRVAARPRDEHAASLYDVFGWHRGFAPDEISSKIVTLLERAEALEVRDGSYGSTVRFATVGGVLLAHPAAAETSFEAVPVGPETARYAAFLARHVEGATSVTEVHCGVGAGGLAIAARVPRVTLLDLDPRALRFARINAAINGIANVDFGEGGLTTAGGAADLVAAHLPFLVDDYERLGHRDAALPCTEMAATVVDESLGQLASGGRLVLCSGTAVIANEDTLWKDLEARLAVGGARADYAELEIDVHAELLERVEYLAVDRLAAVGLVATKTDLGGL